MKKNHRFYLNCALGPITLFGLLYGSLLNADTTRSSIVTTERVTLPYVYESSSNSFALDPTALFEVKLAALTYSAVPKEKCEALRDFFKSAPAGLDAASIRMFYPDSPLTLRVLYSKPYQDRAFPALVQDDLKKQGIRVPLPKNATHLDRIGNELGWKWNDKALSRLGGNGLQAKAQAALYKGLSLTDDESGIQLTATDATAAVTTLCDLQEGNLAFSVSYEYENRFFYFDRGNVRAQTLMTIWSQLSAKAKWIDDIAAKSESMNSHDARLVAAGGLLALEILNSAPQSGLLQAEAFLKTFSSVYNTPTVEVSRFFNESSAEELADRLGKRVETELVNIKGKVDL